MEHMVLRDEDFVTKSLAFLAVSKMTPIRYIYFEVLSGFREMKIVEAVPTSGLMAAMDFGILQYSCRTSRSLDLEAGC